MAKIFITGSADGLGQLTAQSLIRQGHQVVLHARNEARAKQALEKASGAEDVLTGDLSSIEETRALALKANAFGRFDVVIHNAGVYRVARHSLGAECLPLLLTVNTLAPYILTGLMHRSQRLIYLTSGMHLHGDAKLHVMASGAKLESGEITYSDTKLHDLIMAMAIARKWPQVYANAVNPGWVPTKMGGAGAPDNLEKGFETQVWLAVSNEAEARVSGRYFFHKKPGRSASIAEDIQVQENFLKACEALTGVQWK